MHKLNSENKRMVDVRYICPKVAKDKLRWAREEGQTVYIYGTTGCGKTEFVTAVLAKSGYRYFSAEEFSAEKISSKIRERQLACAQTKKSLATVVLDDLHRLETEAERADFSELISKLSAEKDIWLILISRAPVPGWLKKLQIRDVFTLIGEKELRFSRQEQDAYLSKWELSPTEDIGRRLWLRTRGHPLSLRIAAIWLKEIPPDTRDRQMAEERAVEEAEKDLWDYLGRHVYDEWSEELQQFLEKICIVEQFDLSMAQQITSRRDAGRLIRQAQEVGNFVLERRREEKISYELIEVVKDSMRHRLSEKYPQDFVRKLYYSAGRMYELRENMTEALKMYECCQDEEGISRILIANAKKNPAVGSYFELKHYYLLLPAERIREKVELMAGMSMLQSILLNLEESERWYQELQSYAKENRGRAKREAEIRLLYLDIALPQRATASLVEQAKGIAVWLTEKKMVIPEMSVTSNLPSIMNGGKDFCEWSKRDTEFAKKIGKALSIVLGRYGKGLVSLALAESFFEKGKDDYEVAALAGRGQMETEDGGKREMAFVAAALLAKLSVLHGHMANAQDILSGFYQTARSEASNLLGNLEALQLRLALYEGKNAEAYQWLEKAPDENQEFNSMERYRYLTKARVYLVLGMLQKACLLLDKLQYYAQKMHRTYISIEVCILQAITWKRMERQEWQEKLQEAVERAGEFQFVRLFSLEGAALWELLRQSSIRWEKEEFRDRVLEECRQMAEHYPAYLAGNRSDQVVLSEKALKILKLQAEGLSVEQIAHRMNLSKAGVKYYNQETYKRLGVNSKMAAVTEARNRHLI